MNILVTGASGFIGLHVLRRLAANPAHKVFAVVRSKRAIPVLEEIGVKVIECDITDSERLRGHAINPDVVIHLAAVKEHYKDKETTRATNIQGTKNILEQFSGAKQLIFASSTLAAKPLDTYSESKKECEDMIKASGMSYTILRIAPVFGKGDTTNLTRLIAMIRDGKAIPIPGDGKQLIQPTHVDDVTEAIESTMLNGQYLNRTLVVSGKPISLKDFIDLAGRTLNKTSKSLRIPVGFLKPMVRVYQKVSDTPVITVEQLENLGKNQDYDLPDSDFPTSPLEVSIQKTVG